jgi:hypothetical protein
MDGPTNRRRFARFGLRTLFVGVTLIALWLGIALAYWRSADWWIKENPSVKSWASPGLQTTESVIVGLTAALVVLIVGWSAYRVWKRDR